LRQLAKILREHGENDAAMRAEHTLLQIAREWRDMVNKHGGDATVIHRPEVEIKGNATSRSLT